MIQIVIDRHALIEHKTLAVESIVRTDASEVIQDAAVELINLGEATLEQQRACFLATDPASTKQRDPSLARRIQRFGERGKFAKRARVGVHGARERTERDFVAVACVDDGHVRRVEQSIPRRGVDVRAGAARRIDVPATTSTHRDQFVAHFDLQPIEDRIVRVAA